MSRLLDFISVKQAAGNLCSFEVTGGKCGTSVFPG